LVVVMMWAASLWAVASCPPLSLERCGRITTGVGLDSATVISEAWVVVVVVVDTDSPSLSVPRSTTQ
jgi:hypothetical protein